MEIRAWLEDGAWSMQVSEL